MAETRWCGLLCPRLQQSETFTHTFLGSSPQDKTNPAAWPGDVPRGCTLRFRNSFVGTLLSCSYGDGVAIFKSDSASAITIIHECITQQATEQKVGQLQTLFGYF